MPKKGSSHNRGERSLLRIAELPVQASLRRAIIMPNRRDIQGEQRPAVMVYPNDLCL
jgi:hypothetical protein